MASRPSGMVLIEISPELAEFIVDTCRSHIETLLEALDPSSFMGKAVPHASTQEVVNLLENFKMLKNATERALR